MKLLVRERNVVATLTEWGYAQRDKGLYGKRGLRGRCVPLTIAGRSALVAHMARMSVFRVRLSPRRSMCAAAAHAQQFHLTVLSEVSYFVRKIVPLSASSNLPLRSETAPVYAPFE